jgi:predicted metal-dependent enzyme (double-stranded beta helix superfamily)
VISPISRMRRFVVDVAALLTQTGDEALILDVGGKFLEDLVRRDDWLPAAYAEPDPERYRQYLLHCDSLERFSIVAFVWGPGQSTPVHNHTVWGLVGVLRGAETSQSFTIGQDGLIAGETRLLRAGQIAAVSPTIGDIHKVSNAVADAASISIHVYGGNIGAVERSTFDAGGRAKPFISGYANTSLPNIWDGSQRPASAAPARVLH